MAQDELDLETGERSKSEPKEAPKASETPRKRGGRPPGSKNKPHPPGPGSRGETSIENRIREVMERLAEWREGRDDPELADAIRTNARAIAGGLTALTRRVVALRTPLMILLVLIEPIIATGAIIRILAGRWVLRRQAAHAEREAEAAAAQGVVWEPTSPAGFG